MVIDLKGYTIFPLMFRHQPATFHFQIPLKWIKYLSDS